MIWCLYDASSLCNNYKNQYIEIRVFKNSCIGTTINPILLIFIKYISFQLMDIQREKCTLRIIYIYFSIPFKDIRL